MVEIRQNWMDRFLERHADTPKSVWGTSQTMLRGGVANPETVDDWFLLLSETIAKFSIVPELIFVMDETSCFIDKSTRCFKVIGCSNQCAQTVLKAENQESITLIPLVSATGQLLYIHPLWSSRESKSQERQNYPILLVHHKLPFAIWVRSWFLQAPMLREGLLEWCTWEGVDFTRFWSSNLQFGWGLLQAPHCGWALLPFQLWVPKVC